MRTSLVCGESSRSIPAWSIPLFCIATALSLLSGESGALTSLGNCGALPSAEYFRTDPPALRSQVVKTTAPFPKWKNGATISVNGALGPAAEQSDLLQIWQDAGQELRFDGPPREAAFHIFAYSNHGAQSDIGVLCMPCIAPHPLKSDFDIFAGASLLAVKSLDLKEDAPKGQGLTERYWPYDQKAFFWDERKNKSVGNVSGSIAVDRRMRISNAECWINVDLPLAVQTSLINECAVRALGFPAAGSPAMLRLWSEEARKSAPVTKIDDQARSCVTELYGDNRSGSLK